MQLSIIVHIIHTNLYSHVNSKFGFFVAYINIVNYLILKVDDCKLIERQFMMFNISFQQTSLTIISNLANCKINLFAFAASHIFRTFFKCIKNF